MAKNKNDRGSAEMKRGKSEEEGVRNDRGSVKKADVEPGGVEDVEPEVAKKGARSVEGVVMPGEVGELKRGGFWHRVNVLYPWLKFVATVLLVIAVLMGGFGVASLVHGRGAAQVADGGNAQREGDNKDKQNEGDTDEGGSGGSDAKPEDPATKPEEKPADGGAGDNGDSNGGAGNDGTTGNSGSTGNSGGAGNSGSTAVIPSTKPVVVPESATGKKLIALTFDDGPSPANTGRLLDILKEKNVKATFFVLGNLAERNPGLVQRAEAEGHEVGSHTPYHNQQTKLSAAAIQAEAATMNQIFINVLGHSPAFTRPPYGSVDNNVRANLAQPLIMWSIDPEDWKYRNAATVRANVVGAAHDGAIALMHDIHATTVDAVPGIIDDLRAQGYEFLTVSELAKARGVTLQNGYSYYNFRP